MAMADILLQPAATRWAALLRLGIGFAQGLALYLLYYASKTHVWPATDGAIFAPLTLIAGFVPLILLGGLGSLRPRTLGLWALAAAVLLAGLGYYDIARDVADTKRIVPSFPLTVFTAAGLFIAHHLIAASDAERKFIASYPSYFDTAWKHGVQIALALGFVGVFWLLLYLGAALFKLIKIDFLAELIKHRWFAIPATTTMFALAIQLTDVRVGLVRGIRTVALTLLSWLLPVMAVIAVAFLAALPFTGLEPLWNTRSATALVLVATAALVILINATYQDGGPEQQPVAALRYGVSLTALALIPLVAIATYGLWLRIAQYGWTPERIIAAACVVVAACYALGYAAAALRLAAWMKWLEAANVFTAFVVLALLLALFTPLADPARISVADQVRRLEEGKVTPDEFDFRFLAKGGVRYGRTALEKLKTKTEGPQAAVIAAKADAALRGRKTSTVAKPVDMAANITVYPKGQTLPASFMSHDWANEPKRWQLPTCLFANSQCDAFRADIDGDGAPEILLTSQTAAAAVFKKRADDKWDRIGSFTLARCKGVQDALRAGQFKVIEPAWKDLDVNGQRVRFYSTECETLGAAKSGK